MNWRDITGISIISICLTVMVVAGMFTAWKKDEGRCELKLEIQRELLKQACKATIEETLASIDKEFCATWNAELELQKLEASESKKK